MGCPYPPTFPQHTDMPIYAYKCGSCGHAKDVLQKISDAPLTVCPACGAEAFSKQVTAAGFQLKGSGWYVTDFRGGNGGNSAPATEAKSESKTESAAPASAGDAPKKEAASASTPSATSTGGTSAPSMTPLDRLSAICGTGIPTGVAPSEASSLDRKSVV